MTKNDTPPLDLLVIGELNMDLILNEVEGFPELGKEKIANDFNLTLGSSSAIFAANSSRLGLSVGFCGMIGNDDFGHTIIKQLQDYGIDTSLVIQSKAHQTGLTVIIRHDNDRAMTTYPGAMEHFSLADIPNKAFTQARHLHISSIFLQPGIKKDLFEIVKRAKKQGMTISIDPQWDPKEEWDLDLAALLNHVDCFIPNEAEFLQFTKAATVEDGLQKIHQDKPNCKVIVKRGIEGASYLGNGFTSTVPAHKNDNPVDAVGAGDSFNAGFIYQYLQDKEVQCCVQFGNITGAVSTTASGGTAAIKSLEHVQEIAKKKFSINEFTK